MEQIFADGIGRITVIGGIVRLDLVTYSPSEMDANGQPRAVISQRIVMGVDGFLRSSEKVIEAVQVISRNAPQRAAEPQPQQPAPQPQPRADEPPAAPAVSAGPPPPPPPRRLFP